MIRGRVCETRLDAPAKKVSCHQTDRTANQRPRPGCKGWWLSLRGLGALSSGAADTARAGYKRERHERRAERSRRDCSVSINAAISPDRRLLSRLSGRDSELVGSQVAAEQKTAERGDELLRFGRQHRERGWRSRRLAVARGKPAPSPCGPGSGGGPPPRPTFLAPSTQGSSTPSLRGLQHARHPEPAAVAR